MTVWLTRAARQLLFRFRHTVSRGARVLSSSVSGGPQEMTSRPMSRSACSTPSSLAQVIQAENFTPCSMARTMRSLTAGSVAARREVSPPEDHRHFFPPAPHQAVHRVHQHHLVKDHRIGVGPQNMQVLSVHLNTPLFVSQPPPQLRLNALLARERPIQQGQQPGLVPGQSSL